MVLSLISSAVRTSRNNYSGWLFAHSALLPMYIYRTKCGYAINTRAKQYISFALVHAQSTCCRRHLRPPSSPPGIFLSFFLGLDEAVNPVLGSPEIHRYHRVCLRTLSDEFSAVSSCLTPDLDAVCFFLHDVQPPSTEPILKSQRVSPSERSDQN